ncbi:MAG: CoB--CoM heterodisulfide reductase iron-sulfur subunit A family protein [Nitrosomonadales bacterium]|nr:CoB--CoM heterodisulfide reductase iron-sulfur subunit A family protein [Nitrosomonadales bacterium]
MTNPIATSQTILVVGGGISGMTAALEAAECGKQVILLEKSPTLGGRTSLLYRYFPKLCHPVCGLEINLRRLKGNRNVRVITLAEVSRISGARGNYTVSVKVSPRYINENCTACGDCAKAVSAEIPNPYNYGLDQTKVAYLPHDMAYPLRYVLDPSAIGTADADKARAACKYNAVDPGMKPETMELTAGAVIWATGWQPYDAAKIQPYGYDRFPNVITSLEFERMCDPHGPTGGKILRPSDNREAKNIAFIQCAGSRDENHLRHCSRICCMASLKQTQYVREACGEEGKSTVYYIDIRAIDRFEDFYQKVRKDPTVSFIKSKVARIAQESKSGDLILHGVDTEGYHRYANTHDLVVLAIGMAPSVHGADIPAEIIADSSGFLEPGSNIFGAGCASGPLDVNRSVQHATAAALRAIQVINKAAGEEASV